jgi:two-component system CheB/CheR fusion protein
VVARSPPAIDAAGIAADVSPERLARFFAEDPGQGAYRVHKTIRDMLVFLEHDVIKDPPFSRLDLISCRNLLIYLGGELQRKVIPLFHYALGLRRAVIGNFLPPFGEGKTSAPRRKAPAEATPGPR